MTQCPNGIEHPIRHPTSDIVYMIGRARSQRDNGAIIMCKRFITRITVVLMVITWIKRERPDNLELVNHWQGRDISISVSPRQTVQCDGEILKEMPLHVKVIPGAIKVLVPEKKTK